MPIAVKPDTMHILIGIAHAERFPLYTSFALEKILYRFLLPLSSPPDLLILSAATRLHFLILPALLAEPSAAGHGIFREEVLLHPPRKTPELLHIPLEPTR